ncbi:MICOS complex subunit 26/27 isoform X3 [Osmia lignaria lignaria]|uniref:MICOS complex subunit 26/27 isoform X3 n=1 Tax=Osmia lignaria lignaria TaxID=1437193 RepID=UPI0014795075|nr:MICOS complex subunit MIC27 isoform X2 [Osmia lignaria]XP_034182891.1 MICOS complex subunit MIC27 isoform X2 [Osmia lignaria]
MHNYVHKFLESTIGNVFGKDITCREPVHRCDDYQPGVLVEFGRTGIKLFKKFLMPCGLCAAVPAMKPVNSSEERTAPCNTETQAKKLVKPSELPIYSVDDGYNKQMPCIGYPSIVEENIRKVRETIQEVKVTFNNISYNVASTVDQFRFIIDYLQDEANLMPRIGAVGIGGLSGLVLGLRGGMFKRLLYTTTGAGIIGCICFPKEAKQTLNRVEHYGNISYNFVYGVLEKPPEELAETRLLSFHRNNENRSKSLESVTLNEIPNKNPKFKEFKKPD